MVDLRKLAKDCLCVLCSADAQALHHIQVPGNHGMSRKPNDFPWGVRLCHACHAYFHGEGRSDHKLMLIALGRQMEHYELEGILRTDDRIRP